MHIEGVPNPRAMKFVLENGILTDRPYEFASLDEAANSPLARRLMMINYVEKVMLNANYITVLKRETGSPEWTEVLPELRGLIQLHLEDNQPILFIGAKAVEHKRSDDIVVDIIVKLLDEHIRPAAQVDGGDIVFENYKAGVLELSMHGSCTACPYMSETIGKGVEPMMKSMVPEVREVKTRWA